MITPDFVQTMSAYNSWQNRSVLDAANTLSAEALSADHGAFFGSILGTLSHLLWGDTIWMSRFDGWTAPEVGIPGSVEWVADWDDLKRRRAEADAAIQDWARRVTDDDLAGTLSWFSGAMNADVSRPMSVCVMHFLNHQTHHRGQVHTMLTASGAKTGDTDLFIMPGHW